MTAHDKNVPSTTHSPTDTSPDIPDARARRTRTSIIVWRISPDTTTGADITGDPDAGDSPLTERLARHLITIYSDPHDTVVDFDADPNLRRAAEAAGRAYSTITDLSRPDPDSVLPAAAALILLRWPRPATDEAGSHADILLSRCQQHLADHGSTIVVVAATPPDIAGPSYRSYEQVLLPAARTAGLRHLHDIIPIDAVDGRDAFTYATDQKAAGATDSARARQDRVTTLVVFGHLHTVTVTGPDGRDMTPAQKRPKQPRVPVTPDVEPALGDRNLSPGDRDEQPSHQANESRYGAKSGIPLTRSSGKGQIDGRLHRSDLGAP